MKRIPLTKWLETRSQTSLRHSLGFCQSTISMMVRQGRRITVVCDPKGVPLHLEETKIVYARHPSRTMRGDDL